MPNIKRGMMGAAGGGGDPVSGTLWAFGLGADGMLGNGSTVSISSPAQIGSSENWYGIADGDAMRSRVFTTYDGKRWAWGKAYPGALGTGNTTNLSSPVQVGSLTDWSNVIGVGFYKASAHVKTDGTLWTCGNGGEGQLGHGNTTSLSSPVQVGALTTWASVGCGRNHTAAIKTDGTLWTCGKGNQGALGHGNTTNYSSPVQVGSLTNWAKVAGGHQFMVAIKTDGTLWSWGAAGDGKLGNGTTTPDTSSPVQVGSATNWATISVSDNHCLSVTTDYKLFAFGSGSGGKLGLGDTSRRCSPSQVGALTNWLQAQAGSHFSAAVTTDGTLLTWGYGQDGATGHGNTTNYSSPVQVGANTDWLRVSAGYRHGHAIRGV